jgi:hypothetical protein
VESPATGSGELPDLSGEPNWAGEMGLGRSKLTYLFMGHSLATKILAMQAEQMQPGSLS